MRGRLIGAVAVVALGALVVSLFLHNPGGLRGIDPGTEAPPFAVPLARGTMVGDANIAKHAHEGESGERAGLQRARQPGAEHLRTDRTGPGGAGAVRQRRILHARAGRDAGAAELLPDGPRSPPSQIKGSRSDLRTLIAHKGLTYPVGIDADGALASLYKVLSCPQVNFIYPGGKVQSRALLNSPTPAALRSRVAALVAASRAGGRRGAGA